MSFLPNLGKLAGSTNQASYRAEREHNKFLALEEKPTADRDEVTAPLQLTGNNQETVMLPISWVVTQFESRQAQLSF